MYKGIVEVGEYMWRMHDAIVILQLSIFLQISQGDIFKGCPHADAIVR